MIGLGLSLAVCIAALLATLWMVRRSEATLGLPFAYLFALLLIHLPGGWAVMATDGVYGGVESEHGFILTAQGVVAFVAGLALTGPALRTWQAYQARLPIRSAPPPAWSGDAAFRQPSPRDRAFWMFCLIGGWFFVYGLGALLRIPSIGAAVEKGGAVWMLGVMLGLAYALRRGRLFEAALWSSALLVYPVLMLLLGGFMSYGSTTVIIVGAYLLATMRRYWRAALITALAAFMGISLFVNYFAVRKELRQAVWGGAAMTQRIDVMGDMIVHFEIFNPDNPDHLDAIDKRLNQNYFVGVSADRLERGHVDYLYGRSVWEGVLSLIPRIIWPDKPVFGGSPEIVREMTGLGLDYDTSWGVGNVMEFFINFGRFGLAGGFLMLGLVLGILDRQAGLALRGGQLGKAFFFFLPAVALIQPNGSLVELFGGAAAALVAAFFWRWAWETWSRRRRPRGAPGLAGRLRP